MGIPENMVNGIQITNPVNAAEKIDDSVSTMFKLVDSLLKGSDMSKKVNIMI